MTAYSQGDVATLIKVRTVLAADLDGNPCILDDDSNGSAIVDMGAFEMPPLGNRLYLPLVLKNER